MSTQSRFWIRKNMLPEEDLSSLIRCNGVIILRKKQRGKRKIICALIIQSFSPKKEICTYSVKGDLHLFYKRNKGVLVSLSYLIPLNSQGSPKVILWKSVLRTTGREDLQVKIVQYPS